MHVDPGPSHPLIFTIASMNISLRTEKGIGLSSTTGQLLIHFNFVYELSFLLTWKQGKSLLFVHI